MILRLLVLTPVYNGQRTLPRCLGGLLSQNLDYYHVFVTNNCTDKSNQIIDAYLRRHPGKRISWDYPPDFIEKMGDPYAGIAIARQRLLREARTLTGADTKALFLDDDIVFLEPGSLIRLISQDKQVMSGCYMRVFDQKEKPVIAALWLEDDGSWIKIRKPMGLMKPDLVSAGCLLLSRDVVLDERLHFWPIFKPPGETDVSEDFGFSLLLKKNGYKIYLDGGVLPGHFIRSSVDKPWFKSLKKYIPFRYQMVIN